MAITVPWPESLGKVGYPPTWLPGYNPFWVREAAPWSSKEPQEPQPPSTSVPPRALRSPHYSFFSTLRQYISRSLGAS